MFRFGADVAKAQAAGNADGSNAERSPEERRDERRDYESFERRGSGRSRSGGSGAGEGKNSFWIVLFVVFALLFVWNSWYRPPRYEIPIGKLIELIEQGAPLATTNPTANSGAAADEMSGENAETSGTSETPGEKVKTSETPGENAETSGTPGENAETSGTPGENAETSETPGENAETSETPGENAETSGTSETPGENAGTALESSSEPSIVVEEGKGKSWRKVRYSKLANVCVAAHEITGTATREVLEAASGKIPKKPKSEVEFFSGRQGLDVEASYFFELLKKSGFSDIRAQGTPGFMQSYGASLVTTAALVLIFCYFLRRMGAGAVAFGRNRGVLIAQEDVDVSFQDVAGVDEALDELKEIVDFLRTPEKFQALGGRIPKGVLLVGPPGTGKTLLAKAVAGEACVPFFSLSGSDFVELYAGVGAARVRDLFQQAERSSPCIVFIDELDALGKSRSGTAYGGGHDEREQTLNALLVEMDGFGTNSGTIVMAATNRPEILDSALLRSGRFDRQVLVDRPDATGREEILKIHSRYVKLDPNLNLREIASLTPGFVGADLAALVNEAALLAARAGKKKVTIAEFTEAVERVSTGLEKKRRVISPEEKIRVAYHECGHALVAYSLPNADPVHKVSIVPRGLAALGYTLQRPDEERYLMTRGELMARMEVLLAGTIAEELVFDDVSTGAQNDLERATEIARCMTMNYGMSRLGRVAYRTAAGSFLDVGYLSAREHSEQTAWEIDAEIRSLVEESSEKTRQILESRKRILVKLATRLLEKETLDADELRETIESENAESSETSSEKTETDEEISTPKKDAISNPKTVD